MDTGGPMTRSRARGADAGQMPASAAPSTRSKKKGKGSRSSRKKGGRKSLDAANSQPFQQPEEQQEPENSECHDDEPCEETVPATVAAAAAAPAASPAPAPSTVPIAGLTPVAMTAAATPGYVAPTPATMGPSPVMPIKLDSLWSPHAPVSSEQISLTPDATPATNACPSAADAATAGSTGMDLASMFISTPAAEAASPVDGLVAAEPMAAAAEAEGTDSPAQPFAFAAPTDSEAAPTAAEQEPAGEYVAETISFGSFGSPACVAPESSAAAPTAPEGLLDLLPPASPAVAAAAATPGAAAAGSKTPASPFPEDDDDMPPAEDEYPEEVALMQEVLAAEEGAATAEDDDGTGTLQQEQEVEVAGQQDAVDEAMAEPEEVQIAEVAVDEAGQEEAVSAAAPADEEHDDLEAAAESPAAGEFETAAAEPEPAASEDEPAATAADEDEQMGDDDSLAAPEVERVPFPVLQAAAEAPVSPELVSIAAATCSRQRTASTAPKSALAKSSGLSSTVRKSAHVVLPDSHITPKAATTSKKAAAGSAAARISSSATPAGDTGSSPGHTPYPSKAKIKAATTAAQRTNASSAASAKATAGSTSFKKETNCARAHSALKHYAAAAERSRQGAPAADSMDVGSEGPAFPAATPVSEGSSRRASLTPSSSSVKVSSRLLQPTASFAAKTRANGTPDVDPYVWRPASPDKVERPGRLASKIVVPSPAAKGPAAEPSMRALKKSIRDKMEKRAEKTLQESKASSAAHKVHSVHEVRGGKLSSKPSKISAAADDGEDLDFDEDCMEDDYETGRHDDQAADDLAASLSGLCMGQLRIGQPAGPLKGVPAPAGKHLVFDDDCRPKETPASKLRAGPKHTYFSDDGEPLSAAPVQHPRRWR